MSLREEGSYLCRLLLLCLTKFRQIFLFSIIRAARIIKRLHCSRLMISLAANDGFYHKKFVFKHVSLSKCGFLAIINITFLYICQIFYTFYVFKSKDFLHLDPVRSKQIALFVNLYSIEFSYRY